MASDRAKLVLDEQSFQGLLAAAFTIQQHNARMNADDPPAAETPQAKAEQPQVSAKTTEPKASTEPEASTQTRASPAAAVCKQCGGALPSADAPCPSCASSLRPGERLQRNWASLWQMSREQGSMLDARRKPGSELPLSPADPGRPRSGPDDRSLQPSVPTAAPIQTRHERQMTEDRAEEQQLVRLLSHSTDFQPAGKDRPDGLVRTRIEREPAETTEEEATEDSWSGDAAGQHEANVGDISAEGEAWDAPESTPEASPGGLAGLRVKLRFHRADLFLGLAIVVAAVALLWPASGGQKTSLHAWERMLIAIGIAEAPQPVVHFHGDPDLKVWVDPHTALYYCPGDELYGKSPNGRYTTQREAQADRFEPAERSVCVQ